MQVHLNGKNHNPYDDKQLTETQPEPPILDDREPFNDVVKHYDIIAGYKRNRIVAHYPKRVRPWVKLWALLMVVLVAGVLIVQVLRMVTS